MQEGVPEQYARGAWASVHRRLANADRSSPLAAGDLDMLATAAYMLGRDDEHALLLERLHQLHRDAGDELAAARTALLLGMHLLTSGEIGRGSGWVARAQRLVEHAGVDCVERGHMLLPVAFEREAMGDPEGAAAVAAEAATIAERFGDRELLAVSLHMQGHMLVRAGRVSQALPLLDEAMVAVTAGELSPVFTGIVYCGVILACQDAREPRRAQEWTDALSRWCERQPDMVAFTGRCHVHRAELMQLRGAWADALEEARCAARRAALGNHRRALGEAAYLQGEVHRLRGQDTEAEAAYREASDYGREPQPGLALLRLAQGNVDAAAAAIRRALAETTEPSDRTRLLPAGVEIELAAGELDAARAACDELAAFAPGEPFGVMAAIVAQARGAVELADGDARSALMALRGAWRIWDDVGAPYEAARIRALVGAACRALGDEESGALELEAARRELTALGAAPDVARLELLMAEAAPERGGDLTPRELEVLRLVAAGRTNKAIGAELFLSERTVDRHVSNILAKLRVPSRAAATAHAYEHKLV